MLAQNTQEEKRQEHFSAAFSQTVLKTVTLTSATMNHQRPETISANYTGAPLAPFYSILTANFEYNC